MCANIGRLDLSRVWLHDNKPIAMEIARHVPLAEYRLVTGYCYVPRNHTYGGAHLLRQISVQHGLKEGHSRHDNNEATEKNEKKGISMLL